MALDFSTYPPKGHQERIAAYLRFEKLFLGQHKELYLTSPGRYQMVRYIVANFAGLISWLSARPGRSRWAHRTHYGLNAPARKARRRLVRHQSSAKRTVNGAWCNLVRACIGSLN